MAKLNPETRHKVVALHQQGLSQAKISKQTGVSRCAVQCLLKKHKETGNVEDRRRSGRPKKLSAADERHIMLTSLLNRKMSSSAISSELAVTSGTHVHPSTVRRSLGRRAAVALAAEDDMFAPVEDESEDALSDDSNMTEDEGGLFPDYGSQDVDTGTVTDSSEAKDGEDNDAKVLHSDLGNLPGVDPHSEVIRNATGSPASQTGPKPETKDEEGNDAKVLHSDLENLPEVNPHNEVIRNATGSSASQTGPKPETKKEEEKNK